MFIIAQVDDPPEAEAVARLAADASAVSRALRLARGFAAGAGLGDEAAGRLSVVLEEWVANVVEHGEAPDGARIYLRLSLVGAVVRLSVSDGGKPFDPRAAVFEGPDAHTGGGAGLALIAGLARISGTQGGYTSVRRDLDVYALWKLDPQNNLRVAVSNLLAQDYTTESLYSDASGTLNRTTVAQGETQLRVTVEKRF